MSVNRIDRILREFRAAKKLIRSAAIEERERFERRRQLEADRAPRLKAMREYPAPGRRDCPECGYYGRTEVEWRWLKEIDWKLVTYRCDKCLCQYDEMEACESNEMEHYHDYVSCGAGYVCNAEGCRDGEYSDGHNCLKTKEQETLCQQH